MWKWFLNKIKNAIEDEILKKMRMHQEIYNVAGDFIITGNNLILQYITVNSYGSGTGIRAYGAQVPTYYDPCKHNFNFKWNGNIWYPLRDYSKKIYL
jgi:hypothetical protein